MLTSLNVYSCRNTLCVCVCVCVCVCMCVIKSCAEIFLQGLKRRHIPESTNLIAVFSSAPISTLPSYKLIQGWTALFLCSRAPHHTWILNLHLLESFKSSRTVLWTTETSPDFTSTWGWVDNDRVVFISTVPLKEKVKLNLCTSVCLRWFWQTAVAHPLTEESVSKYVLCLCHRAGNTRPSTNNGPQKSPCSHYCERWCHINCVHICE